jgi:conjugal transfer pilus assembly protein TraB
MNSEFHGGRIFGSSTEALYKERDGRLAKQAQDYADSFKALKDQVTQVEKKVSAIEVSQGVHVNADGGAKAGATNTGHVSAAAGSLPPAAGIGSQPGAATLANGGQEQASLPVGSGRSPSGGVPMPAASPPALPRMTGGPWSSGRALPPGPTRGPATVSFPVRSEEPLDLGIVLPPGSYVRAKMLTGVAAPEGRPYPVLLQADYAYILPSRHRLDLSGCFVIAKAQGDLSTERLQMQATKMSCVGRDGRMFERDVTGFVADDKDNNFAVAGEVISKQDRVAAMAFLASVVEGVGKAIQQAQTTQQTTPLGGSQSVMTGDQQKYLAAGGASDAAGRVAEWYLKEAQSLLPTINVNSGQSVWVVMQESVNLPKSYFKRHDQRGNHDDPYGYVTRLLE